MRNISLLILVWFLLIGITACNTKEDLAFDTNTDTWTEEKTQNNDKVENDESLINENEFFSSKEATEITAKHVLFSSELLSATYKRDRKNNVAISPLSASLALGMLTNALEENERTEIYNVLNLEAEDLAKYNIYNEYLMESLKIIDPTSILFINNGSWFSGKAILSEEYENILLTNYKAELFRYDTFTREILEEINDWIKEKTKNMIPSILNPGEESELINQVWVNTLYFNSLWSEAFDKKNTYSDYFYSEDFNPDEQGKVEMMNSSGTGYYNYYLPKDKSDEFGNYIRTVILPYGNRSFYFLGVMPADNNYEIETTLNCLDIDYWSGIDKSLETSYIDDNIKIGLPTFKIDNQTDLLPILQDMGIQNIFNSVSMESSLNLTKQEIKILRQKVNFEIKEDGSQLTSGTIIVGGDAAAPPDYNPPHFIFNRPFIYFVREKTTGSILLAGVYSHP